MFAVQLGLGGKTTYWTDSFFSSFPYLCLGDEFFTVSFRWWLVTCFEYELDLTIQQCFNDRLIEHDNYGALLYDVDQFICSV